MSKHSYRSATFYAGVYCLVLLGCFSRQAAGQIIVASQNASAPPPAGATIYDVSPNGSASTFASLGSGSSAYGLAFDSSGNLFVAGSAGGSYLIEEISPSGTASVFHNFGTNSYTPTFLAFGTDGDLYASTYSSLSPGVILKLTPTGAVSTYGSGIAAGTNGIAFDKSGDLFVASGGQSIAEITPNGTTSTFVTGLSGAYELAFDASGNLFSSNLGNNTISKITPGGSFSTFASGVSHPEGLAFDAQGNLFVGTANGIDKITPGGTVSLFSAGVTNAVDLEIAAAPEPSSWTLGLVGVAIMLGYSRLRRLKR